MSLTFKIALDRYLGGTLIFVLNIFARLLGLFLKRDHSLRVRGDILLIKMLGGGSLVMAMPALLGIRRAYPDVKIRLFTTGAVKPFAETLGIFDDILVLNDRSLWGLVTSGLRLLKICFGADTVIDLEIYSCLSTVLSLLTFARNRIGFFYEETGFRQRLHTHRIFFHLASPLYMHYDRIAALLGAGIVPVAECAVQLRRVLGLPVAGSAAGRVAIGCGCSGLSSERKLAPGQWAQYVFLPAPDKQREAVFLGAPSDRETSAKVIAAIRATPGAWQGGLTNACGTTSLQEGIPAAGRLRRILGDRIFAAALRAAARRSVSGLSGADRSDPFPADAAYG